MPPGVRRMVLVLPVLPTVLLLSGCGGREPARADSAAAARAARPREARGAAAASAPAPALALVVDTGRTPVLEFWPLDVAPGRQLQETQRIVEHLQADVAILPGFGGATLLATGDGSGLLVVLAWDEPGAAERASTAIIGWLRTETDSAARRRRLGTATARVIVRRTAGAPPVLGEAAMVQVTRYALKPGHSFGALVTLADSNLAMRVLQDTAAQGGATLAATDSGAVYMVMQARNATALDPDFRVSGPLPFWAPFAVRSEALMAVVATIPRR